MILTKNYPSAKFIDNVFNDLFQSIPSRWAAETVHYAAPVNISETDAGYLLEFLVPGRRKEDFTLSLDNKMLTVSYQKPEESGTEKTKVNRKEFDFSSFKRSFHVEDKVNTEAIEARYENGILSIFMPKREDVKNSPKQISIQ